MLGTPSREEEWSISHIDWPSEEAYLRRVLDLAEEEAAQLRDAAEHQTKTLVSARREMWRDLPHAPTSFDETLSMLPVMKELAGGEQRARDTVARLRRMERVLESPYFGRVDFLPDGAEETETYYFGLTNVYDEDGNVLVCDWRAPAAELFYEFDLGPAHFAAPAGDISGELMLRRQYKVESSRLVRVVETGLHVGDEVLQELIARSPDGRMRPVVHTIQREQHEAIRRPAHRSLLVTGPAGSGKTAVALHRAAHLIYRGQGEIDTSHMLFIVPNEAFADHVARVLPELGEAPLPQFTFPHLLAKYLNLAIYDDVPPLETILSGDRPEAAEHLRRRWRKKTSQDRLDRIRHFVKRKAQTPARRGGAGALPGALRRRLEKASFRREDAALVASLAALLQGIADYRIAHVILEEAQSYSLAELAVLRLLFPKAAFTCVYDPNQVFLPDVEASSVEAVASVLGENTDLVTLTQCYRSTREITEFCADLIGRPTMAMGASGAAPRRLSAESEDDRLRVLEMDLAQRTRDGAVAVIAPTLHECRRLATCLRALPIQVIDGTRPPRRDGTILLLPSYLSRGLEFESVYVWQSDRYGSRSDSGSIGDDDPRVLYTVCSRATRELVLI